MWTMITLLLLRLFSGTADHLSFFCLMTLAHIVCWSRCNTDIQMTLSDDNTFFERLDNNAFWEAFSKSWHPKTLHSLETLSEFNVRIYPPAWGGVLKVFITNLPSTCWLPRISGQFCDGSFSKSVINTKTALTRLSIQNNLFLRATFIIMGYYWMGT